MQISSNHSGFNFTSVYKSVVTRHTAPNPVQGSDQSGPREVAAQPGEENAEKVRRETLLLQAAQRSAERTANFLTATPDL